MILWFFQTFMCAATAIGIALPLLRKSLSEQATNNDAAIYEDQLKEIERDQFNGAINAPEASSAKLEIQRRLAFAKKHTVDGRPVSKVVRSVALASAVCLVIFGSFGLYGLLGSPNLPSGGLQSDAAPDVNATAAQVDALMEKLVAHLNKNPEDAEGWRMLGWSQFDRQNYAQAAESYSKAANLQPTNMDYKSAYAEALVQLGQGVVTPKAQDLIAEVLRNQPKDSRARFYDALAHEQSGDQSGALDRWLALLADTPADAGWRNDVQLHITDLAKATGRVITDVAPSAPAISEAQKQAIQALPESDQNTMIRNMVDRLAAKLHDNPNDLEGWLRLLRSYQVLGESAKAKTALGDALLAFTNDSSATAKLTAAATELGIN